MLNKIKIAGIDYGSKYAGTTVIAYFNENKEFEFAASSKKEDADRFILEWAKHHQPDLIFLDAPLSLPGIYQNLAGCDDYFYRAADRALQAMSPMFLGGLTARAIKLKADLQIIGIDTLEVYPGHLAKILNLDKTLYKKEKNHIDTLLSEVNVHFSIIMPQLHPAILNSPTKYTITWHHFDAALALLSGLRYLHQQHLTFGDGKEGLIII